MSCQCPNCGCTECGIGGVCPGCEVPYAVVRKFVKKLSSENVRLESDPPTEGEKLC